MKNFANFRTFKFILKENFKFSTKTDIESYEKEIVVPTTTVSMTRSENEINSDNTIATDKTVFDEESDLDSGKNESDEDEEYTVDDTDEEDTTETENVEIENISESTSTLSPLIVWQYIIIFWIFQDEKRKNIFSDKEKNFIE